MTQISLIQGVRGNPSAPRFQLQLFKWIGNKQRFAHEIVSYFPPSFHAYIEPFLGSGAVLGTLAPSRAIAGDILEPLMGIWFRLSDAPDALLRAYTARWHLFQKDRQAAYERILARFNKRQNPDDLLFLSRSCYGGVVRFRKDGFMSTPIGVHSPISPASMEVRVRSWHH
ncbi:MAG: DNA adenine methylase, partial [bacterium]|nr:DNA adenine methylase [bacterium]